MIDLERELRDTFARHERDLFGTSAIGQSSRVLRRVRRRQTRTIVVASAMVVGIVAGSIAARGALFDRSMVPEPASGDTFGHPSVGAIAPGPLASLSGHVPAGTVRLTAMGTPDDRVCLRIVIPGEGAARSCIVAEDLGTPFEPFFAQPASNFTEGRGLAFGIVSVEATSVELRYAGGGVDRGTLVTVDAAGYRFQVFLLASSRRIGRGVLGAYDANGAPVGQPQWTIWGTPGAPEPSSSACPCKRG